MAAAVEKYDVIKRVKDSKIPDLFAEREGVAVLLLTEGEKTLSKDAPEIRIPRILYFHEMFPFGEPFYRARLPSRSVGCNEQRADTEGSRECCCRDLFSHQVSHGHVLNLLEKGVKRIFLPSIVNLKPFHPDIPVSTACPYAQSFPMGSIPRMDFKKAGIELLQPIPLWVSGERRSKRN